RLRHHRVGAEPLAEKGVELLVLCQHAMRPVMHQNGKAKLPRADHHDGEDIGERIWEGDENGHRPEDYAPGMKNKPCATQIRAFAHQRDLARRENILRKHAHAIALRSSILLVPMACAIPAPRRQKFTISPTTRPVSPSSSCDCGASGPTRAVGMAPAMQAAAIRTSISGNSPLSIPSSRIRAKISAWVRRKKARSSARFTSTGSASSAKARRRARTARPAKVRSTLTSRSLAEPSPEAISASTLISRDETSRKSSRQSASLE